MKSNVRIRHTLSTAICCASLMFVVSFSTSVAWIPMQNLSHHHRSCSLPSCKSSTCLWARRSKRLRQEADDLNRWYDSVDADASPDDVFWEEMERQRLLSELGGSNGDSSMTTSPIDQPPPPPVVASAIHAVSQTAAKAMQSPKNVEATLSSYEAFAVDDNWLDEELYLNHMHGDEEEQEVKSLDEQLEDWENEVEGDADGSPWMTSSDEPWDHWGEEDEEESTTGEEKPSSPFLLDEDNRDEGDKAEEIAEKEAFLERLSRIGIRSRRLERARQSPKAAAFFGREPNAFEGYDRLWVSAIDNVCIRNLVGTFRNYGVEFADNFGDWEDSCTEDGLFSIEDVASFKARQVYEVTGLPCIASRTSFEVEPIPNLSSPGPGGRPAGSSIVANANPRVVSGYRFNDIGQHVDYICEALKPLSAPSRVTRFKTCFCFFDGAMEIYDYGVCDCDLHFASSLRTFVPVAQAINEMIKTLELTFGLEYQRWLKLRLEDAAIGFSGASLKLRDRVLKEGRVLPNDIIDVSAFMDAQVDVNLMDECARDLAERFMSTKPNKILTVATTGLVIALPLAKYLQVPVVYARKERSVVMADTYKASYSSNTVGKNRELLVAKSHLDEDDRVLVIDDFLSSGSVQEALLRIASDSGATVVGVGVLLEKVYESGRQALSGFDVPIHSLCRVASVEGGVIQLLEEEGFSSVATNNEAKS